jgi:hypothetical protein
MNRWNNLTSWRQTGQLNFDLDSVIRKKESIHRQSSICEKTKIMIFLIHSKARRAPGCCMQTFAQKLSGLTLKSSILSVFCEGWPNLVVARLPQAWCACAC